MKTNSSKEVTIEEDILRGKTLPVYEYLLKNSPSGIRQIQKALNLPSPSSVSYHINKLVEAGIVHQNNQGKYFLVKKVETTRTKLVDRLLLRYIIYFSYFVTILIIYALFLNFPQINMESLNIIAFLFMIVGTGIFACELYFPYR